jgi:hypothetical protein
MEIKYLDDKVVLLRGKSESVLVNPSEDFLLKDKGKSRVVLFTSEDKGRADLKDDKVFINGVGEYEIGGVEIIGFGGNNGNTLYRVNIDGFKVVVIGALKEELSDKKLEKLEECDVLIVLLDEFALDHKVFKDWTKKWGANYLIPISEDKNLLNKLLDSFDEEGLEAVPSLKLEKQEDLPDGLEVKLLCKNK